MRDGVQRQHRRRSGRRGVAGELGHRATDRAGGERLRASFSDLRIDAAGDRIPHQLRQPRRGAERVQHGDRARRAVGVRRLLASSGGQQQVIDLGQRGQPGAAVGQ